MTAKERRNFALVVCFLGFITAAFSLLSSSFKYTTSFTVEYSVFIEGQKACSSKQQALQAISYKYGEVFAVCDPSTRIKIDAVTNAK